MMIKFIFWFSLSMMLYTYIGYPSLITVIAGFKKKRSILAISAYPKVSIIIPVFNEADVIKQKIDNCLKINYPKDKLEILIGSDGSNDGTDKIAQSYTGQGIKFFSTKERQGKPSTINKLVKASSGEILFFSDARQLIANDALIKLVRNFADPEVGCASGELIYRRGSGITGRGIGLYWEYEKYLRQKESDIYSMIGATGAIYACRKKLFEPLPQDIVLDDVYTPLSIVKKGYRAIFDRTAFAFDDVSVTPREEHIRKKRTLFGNYQIFFRIPDMLNPFKSKLAFQIISHKLLRVLMPFFMVSCFVSNLILAAAPFYSIIFVFQALFYITALIEALFRRRIRKIFGIPYLFCLLNFSALAGLWSFLFNQQNIKWEKVRMAYE
jgi:cellulose synthase/poly-beta-1,6-N-acetylglucosamine synthase-like glycosyltransferase